MISSECPGELLRAADLQLHTTRTDTMPGVVVRGMAGGVPAVVSRVGGLPEIVTREVGRQVPLTAAAIAAAIVELARDDALRIRLGRAARTPSLERFEAGGWVARLREVYESALAHPVGTGTRWRVLRAGRPPRGPTGRRHVPQRPGAAHRYTPAP
ncbi:glycosyltransferase [Pseudonocardia kujensis]|uniref:glycosyltransferase n=1 Tax=Pseudonocardia kujensis TaxID=1128675 RepID=UPI001E40CCAD|nr:glycosyltransferase [Pseudonocardia kujensis]MCE0762815.1 glycosyltransferase [Pseudonocardia kujensis]